MSEGRMTAEQTPDIETLAEEFWASSASPGAAPTDADRDLARRFLESDWLAAAVREARAAELREAAGWLPSATEGTDRAGTETWRPHDRDVYSLAIEEAQVALRARADRIAVDAPEGGEGR